MRQWFDRFATACAYWLGHPAAFAASLVVVLAWAGSGQLFGYSDTWQLVINTSTTVITFLAVFVIQHTQNRDTLATRVQLEELIHAVRGARDELLGIDKRPEEEIEQLRR